MYGMDLFFKAAAMGMKIAQESVENMNSLLEIAAKNVPQAESEDDEASPEKEAKSESPREKSPPAESAKSEDVPSAPHTAKPPSEPAYETTASPPDSHRVPEDFSQTEPKRAKAVKAEPERQEVSSADQEREEPAETEPERQEASATDAADAVAAEDDKPETAIDTVLAFMAEKNTPLATEEIMEATGFAKRKVQDNLYRLKKRGEIEMVEKGVYVVS